MTPGRRWLAGLVCAVELVAGAGEVVAQAPAATHEVRRGDTLYSIAFQFGYAYQQVAAWNRINPPYTIYVGQRLRITPPGQSSVATMPPPAVVPTV